MGYVEDKVMEDGSEEEQIIIMGLLGFLVGRELALLAPRPGGAPGRSVSAWMRQADGMHGWA